MSDLSCNQPASQSKSRHFPNYTQSTCPQPPTLDMYFMPSVVETPYPVHHTITGCSTSTNNLPANQQTITQLSDDVFMQDSITNDKSISTFQTDVVSSCDKPIPLDPPPFDQPLHVPITCEKNSNRRFVHPFSKQPFVSEEQQNQFIHFPTMNNIYDTANMCTTTHQYPRKETKPATHGPRINPTAFKQTTTSADKKEMRARRNRESARRSRLKTKQHFQSLERSFVILNKENKDLRRFVDKLLPKCAEKSSDDLTESIQSLWPKTL